MDYSLCFNARTGRRLEGAEAPLSAADRAFRYGDGVFETIRVERGAPVRMPLHLARYAKGIYALGLAAEPTILSYAVHEYMAASPLKDGLVRATLSAGAGGAGYLRADPALFPPVLHVSMRPLPPARRLLKPVALWTARSARVIPPACLPAGVKHLSRLNAVLAAREARARGADDALMLTPEGFIGETASGNLFFRIGGRWFTPSCLRTGAVEGVARAHLLTAMLGCAEIMALPHMLARADAVIVTNVSGGARPVRALYPQGYMFPESVAAARRLRVLLRRRNGEVS